jgi:putative PIN family toxin of toxin-antitoxin system
MKIFFDSNVLISIAASHQGFCNRLFQHCIGRHAIYICPFVLAEVEEKLHLKIKLTTDESRLFIDYLKSYCRIVKDAKLVEKVSRDPKDDPVLATAFSSGAKYLLTGDKDLLVLKEYRGIPIIKPGDFKVIDETFKG